MEENIWAWIEAHFLINSEGKVIKEWRSVKVKGHVQEVLDTVKELVR